MHVCNKIEAYTHKSAKTHAGTVFGPRDPDIWLFEPRINGLPLLIVEHSYAKFGDPSCIVLRYCAEKQTDRQTDNENPAPAVGVGKDHEIIILRYDTIR